MQDEVKPDTGRALRTLKTFQRDTVDHVFQRMYLDDQPVRRFLVADEVGLGKTLVARGIVARMVDHLWRRCGGSISSTSARTTALRARTSPG
jgi:hypothetical protein